MGESKVKVFPLQSQNVSRSAHVYFWDYVYTCPCPVKNQARFYQSLAFFLLHVLEVSVFTPKKYGQSVPVPKNWIAKSQAAYAMWTHKTEAVKSWLDKLVIVYESSRKQKKCAEYEFHRDWLRGFNQCLLIDEDEFDLTVEKRRRPVSSGSREKVERSLVKSIRPYRFGRPSNFNPTRSPEMAQLIRRAEANQRPCRLKIDRLLDCLQNLRKRNKVAAYIRLKGKFDKICRLKLMLVDDKSGDRVVEFYDRYHFASKGGRLFGTVQGLPKIVKRLCFDHSYGRNFDMPSAQRNICIELMEAYQINSSALVNVNHDKTARALNVTRDTAKALMFGGMFKIWRNVMWYKKRKAKGRDDILRMTDLHKILRKDLKVARKLKKMSEGKTEHDAREVQNQFITELWAAWKKEHADIARVVNDLCSALIASKNGRRGSVICRFKNDMDFNFEWETKSLNRGKTRSSILSHFIQGIESRRLLEALASNPWCSAEFDGAVFVHDYNQIVPMIEKPFCDDTVNILLFEKLWSNGYALSDTERCILTRTVQRDMENTVNTIYLQFKEQREGNHGEDRAPCEAAGVKPEREKV